MPNLLLSFEDVDACEITRSLIMQAQLAHLSNQPFPTIRFAALLQRLQIGCMVYGPLPDGRWLPDAGPQSPGSPAPSATHTPNTATLAEFISNRKKAKADTSDTENTERIWCAQCGKPVSTPVPKPTIVRAWVECPECIAKGHATKDLENALRLLLSVINDNWEILAYKTPKEFRMIQDVAAVAEQVLKGRIK